MNLLRQLLKEFWIPLTASILWMIYNIYDANIEAWDLKRIVNTFGPTFFFVSWFTGQFFRVNKQVKLEGSLGKMETRLEQLLSELETKTKNMINHISGGDSFPWLQIGMIDHVSDQGMLMAIHNGDHPLYDVSVRIVDLNIFQLISKNLTLSNLQMCDTNIDIGNLIPGHSKILSSWKIAHSPMQDYNIFFSARNGRFTQLVRLRKINGQWLVATKVTDQNDKVIHEQIDQHFPRNNNGMVVW